MGRADSVFPQAWVPGAPKQNDQGCTSSHQMQFPSQDVDVELEIHPLHKGLLCDQLLIPTELNSNITQRPLQLLAQALSVQILGHAGGGEPAYHPWVPTQHITPKKPWGAAKGRCERIHSARGQEQERLWDSQSVQVEEAKLPWHPMWCCLMHRELLLEIREKK